MTGGRRSARAAGRWPGALAAWALIALAPLGCSHDWDALLYAGEAGGVGGAAGGGVGGGGGSAWLEHGWSHAYSVGADENAATALGLAVAPNGEVGLAGTFVTDVDLGNQVLTTAGNDDIFVARLTAGGGTKLGQAYGDTSVLQAATGVAMDGTGAMVVVGMVAGSVNLGGGAVTASGLDAFVARYEPSGQHLWSTVFGGVGVDAASAVAVNAKREVFVVGSFTDKLEGLPSGCLLVPPPVGGSDIFVLKLEQGGTCAWVRRFGSVSGNEAVAAVAADDSRVLITGSFDAAMVIGDPQNDPLLTPLGTDLFLAALDASTGKVQWSYRYGDADEQQGAAIALAPGGDVVVAGVLHGTPDLGGGPLEADDAGDAFAMRLDEAGQHLWSVAWGDGAAQVANSVAVDAEGHSWVAGGFSGTLAAGSTVLTAQQMDVFLVELDTAGSPLHAQSWGDAFDGQQATEVALDASGAVLLAGAFRGSIDFGGGVLLSDAPPQARDDFVAKLLPAP